MVRYLAETVGVELQETAKNGVTIFFVACYRGDLAMVRYLADLGVDTYVPASNGTMALTAAERFQHPAVAQFVTRVQGATLARPLRANMCTYLALVNERQDNECQLNTHLADVVHGSLAGRHVVLAATQCSST